MTLLARWRAWLRARLVDDWTRALKFSSVQMATAGALLTAFVQWFPGTATEVWNALPQDMRALLPAWLTSTLPVILLVAIALARITRKAPTDGK
ncbi:DUF7940 domain-containing protein [Sphingomonas sp. HMP6]|uniref:DUF7940 domain-containing protein n=1 Tax=Sphingomonas sp. HMP6 TaxID=1517551 RepID=UPI00159651AC|nr:hypothetical protein [Sphingomonas sp. HMP6]BCA57670.1 hypothetical protein HMP06_0439 [Sphingomonas sp. HMP6]